jgi:hypothetical protein
MTSIVVPSFAKINHEKVKFSPICRNRHGMIRSQISYDDKDLIFKGPRMFLGNRVLEQENHLYFDLILDPSAKQTAEFKHFANLLEETVLGHLFQNRQSWYAAEVSMTQIEYDLCPVIKRSVFYPDRDSLKIRTQSDQVEIFDQDDVLVPFPVLRAGYPIIPVFQIEGVTLNGHNLRVNWSLHHMRVKVPEISVKGCMLADVTEGTEEIEDCSPDTEDTEDTEDTSDSDSDSDSDGGDTGDTGDTDI